VTPAAAKPAHGLVCLGLQVHVAVVAYAVCCLDAMPLFYSNYHHRITTVLRPFFWDHPGELVPEENFWTLWSKGRLTEEDTPTIQLGATPTGLTSAHLHHPFICFILTGFS